MPSLRNGKRAFFPVVISVAAAIILTAAIFLYSAFDPADSVFWPKCPFYLLTGLECPGCGSQRAIHSLLNGDPVSAMHYNLLLVLAIPYLLLYAVLVIALKVRNRIPGFSPEFAKLCKRLEMALYHGPALRVVLAVILLFWLFRNFTPTF